MFETNLLQAKDVAKRLSISERNLFDLTKKGEITACRIGRLVRYDPAEIAAFVNKAKEIKT